jgi:hypothetical protein
MSEWLSLSSVRSSVHPGIYEVLEELDGLGWRIRRQGHNLRVYCPCDRDSGGRGVAVPGSPRVPERDARRLRRNAELCPDSHELMK